MSENSILKGLTSFDKDESKILKARIAFVQKEAKKLGIDDIAFTSTQEYDDNNYYTYCRPTSLGQASLDIADLQDDDGTFEVAVEKIRSRGSPSCDYSS